MVSVDDIRHQTLEFSAATFLRSSGFHYYSATYHDVLRDRQKLGDVNARQVCDRLQLLDTPTALYVRTRPDRIAVHKTLPICFELEFKTRLPSTRQTNMTFEAIPFAHNVLKSRLGVKTLYCYSDSGMERGFWCSAHPPIACIFIPTRSAALEAYLQGVFPNVSMVPLPWTRGSDDAFVKIEFDEISKCCDWRDLVTAQLHAFVDPQATTCVKV